MVTRQPDHLIKSTSLERRTIRREIKAWGLTDFSIPASETARGKYRASDKGRATEEKYRSKNKGGQWRADLWRLYKFTSELWDTMLRTQGGHCAICPSTDRLCVDHDHRTGKVRGILCHQCNVALGFARDSEHILLALIEYLRKNT